jgi:DNA-binding winged helix-turn-helix (wHTH) protein
MDQILSRTLTFERFELDIARGCARVAGSDVGLRPKTFDTLRCLAENAGRLVSRQELHDAVWGHLAVSDDVLVQCIRELRQRLGDTDHTLIKTVPRRGYLLNASEIAPALALAAVPREAAPAHEDAAPQEAAPAPAAARPWYRGELGRWAAAALVAVMALGSIPLARAFSPQNLVSAVDVRRVADLAAAKELPIPPFRITSLAEDVPDPVRRFVGVWVSETGWEYSDRQFMVIVTNVSRHGDVQGYMVNGPSKPHSRQQGPAFILPFKGYMNAGTLRYDAYVGMYLAELNRDGEMKLKLVFKDGVISVVKLKPVWTLPKGTPAGTNVAMARY